MSTENFPEERQTCIDNLQVFSLHETSQVASIVLSLGVDLEKTLHFHLKVN